MIVQEALHLDPVASKPSLEDCRPLCDAATDLDDIAGTGDQMSAGLNQIMAAIVCSRQNWPGNSAHLSPLIKCMRCSPHRS